MHAPWPGRIVARVDVRPSLRVGLVLAGFATLVACGSSDDSATSASSPAAAAPAAGLEGPTWMLVEGGELDVPLGTVEVSARFTDGTVSGSSGCNSYRTTFDRDGASLTISPSIAATQKACGPDETAVEQAYLQLLPTVRSYAVDDSTLSLLDAEGDTVLSYRATSGATAILGDWTATSYYTGSAVTSVVGGVTLTATFDTSQITGQTGCNSFHGAYELDGERIRIGPLASTKKACTSTELAQQEQHYLRALELATSYRVTGTRLDLFRPGETYAATFERS
jgi:heat shock protein HslJ